MKRGAPHQRTPYDGRAYIPANGQPFTSAGLAARWGMHPGTLANWRVQEEGPPYRKRGKARTSKVVYPVASTLRWGRANGYEPARAGR